MWHENGRGGLTEHEDGNETEDSVYHRPKAQESIGGRVRGGFGEVGE